MISKAWYYEQKFTNYFPRPNIYGQFIRDSPFSTYEKFSEKLTFLTPDTKLPNFRYRGDSLNTYFAEPIYRFPCFSLFMLIKFCGDLFSQQALKFRTMAKRFIVTVILT